MEPIFKHSFPCHLNHNKNCVKFGNSVIILALHFEFYLDFKLKNGEECNGYDVMAKKLLYFWLVIGLMIQNNVMVSVKL